MRFRLIQPPLVQPRYRQLTLPVVGAELAAHGLEVEVCDENIEPLDTSPVDAVGITCHVYNAPRAFALARLFRARGVPVIFGGTFPTVAPDLVAPHADAVVIGELEGQSAALVRDLRAGTLQPRYQAAKPPSLAETVRPAWSLLRSGEYLRFNFPLETSRGCRFACGFCTAQTLYGPARTRAPADIARDLADYDHGLVELVDVNFLNDHAFFVGQVAPMLRAAPIPGWMGQATIADLDADPGLPQVLADSGCKAVFVGLESIDDEALRAVRKGWSRPERLTVVARRLQEAGVLVQVGLVVGLDTDSRDRFERTAEFLERHRIHAVSVSYLHYYPGTDAYEALAAAGRLHSTDWRDYDGARPVIAPSGLSTEALEAEVNRFLRRMYGVRSIARRGLHRGTLSDPRQLLHHLAINGSLGSYYGYQALERSAMGRLLGASRPRYDAAVRGDRLARAAADAASRVLDRLWRRRF